MSKIESAKATPGSTKKSGESGAPPPTRVPQEPQAQEPPNYSPEDVSTFTRVILNVGCSL